MNEIDPFGEHREIHKLKGQNDKSFLLPGKIGGNPLWNRVGVCETVQEKSPSPFVYLRFLGLEHGFFEIDFLAKVERVISAEKTNLAAGSVDETHLCPVGVLDIEGVAAAVEVIHDISQEHFLAVFYEVSLDHWSVEAKTGQTAVLL